MLLAGGGSGYGGPAAGPRPERPTARPGWPGTTPAAGRRPSSLSLSRPGQRGANATRPGQQGANAPRPGQRGANAPRPGQRGANTPRAGQRGANAQQGM
eukprot:jgi/Tetstr1/465079/TSEL_009807.t1